MEGNSKNERGITLIALIITIIVMLILVAVSISIALNTGLFESAGKATKDWKTAQDAEQEISTGKITIGNKTYNSIDEYQKQKSCTHEWGEWNTTKQANCSEEGIKTRTCTKCGQIETELIPKTQDHILENGVCTKCGQTYSLVIGATIVGYDPSVGTNGTISTSYTSKGVRGDGTIAGGASGNGYGDQTFTVKSMTEWQVLGEENGQVIITPTTPIKTDASMAYSLRGQAGYINFLDELDKISGLYGQGKYADTSKYSVTLESETIASGGRSIKLEDIAIVDVTPRTKTYTKNADDGYIYTDGIKSSETKFIYWGEDVIPSEGAEWKTLGSGESVTITYAGGGYSQHGWTTLKKHMIYGKNSDLIYWISTPDCLWINTGLVSYSGNYVYNNLLTRDR